MGVAKSIFPEKAPGVTCEFHRKIDLLPGHPESVMIKIIDPEDPRVSMYKNLRANTGQPGTFISDHEKIVLRHLESNLPVNSIYTTLKYYEKYESLIGERVNPEKIYIAEQEVMEKTIGFPLHQGCMSSGTVPGLKKPMELTGNLLYCHGIVDAENMGSILRTGASMGIHSVLLSTGCITPFHRRSVRVSMGNVFRQSFGVGEFSVLHTAFKELGYTWIALSLPRPGRDTVSIYHYRFPEKFILVLGNESEGIPEDVLCAVDAVLTIPMKDGVDSLNVSHSLAVALAFWSAGLPNLQEAG